MRILEGAQEMRRKSPKKCVSKNPFDRLLATDFSTEKCKLEQKPRLQVINYRFNIRIFLK